MWIVYNYCTFTPLRAPPKISSDEGWKNILTTGVDCVELSRSRLRSSHSNRHHASPASDQRRGKHWSMMELTWPAANRPRPRLSPLSWLSSLETRRDWHSVTGHRALSLLRLPAQRKMLHDFWGWRQNYRDSHKNYYENIGILLHNSES